MNVAYWLVKFFRTNQFPLVSMANLEHLVLQEGICGCGAYPFQHSFLFAFWVRVHIACLFWGTQTCEITKGDLCVNHYVCVFAFCAITSTLRELYESCKGGGAQHFLELVVTLNK
jgi:hypothetical protein